MLKKGTLNGLLLTVGIVITLFSTVVYSSCKKTAEVVDQACIGVICQNNGVCIDGSCSCTGGFSGRHCEVKNNARYIGKWNFSQQIISSNDQASIGKVSNYEVSISEDAAGVTVIRIDGFYGLPSSRVTARIGMKIDLVETAGGGIEEVDVLASPSNFVFKRYQPLQATSIQLVKGQGSINELGTQITGTFETIRPNSVKGAVEETITFTAEYID